MERGGEIKKFSWMDIVEFIQVLAEGKGGH